MIVCVVVVKDIGFLNAVGFNEIKVAMSHQTNFITCYLLK